MIDTAATENGLITTLISNPLDISTRLILADYYEDIGKVEQSGWLRQDGRLILSYDCFTWITSSLNSLIIRWHVNGGSYVCTTCRSGVSRGRHLYYSLDEDGNRLGWVCGPCYERVTDYNDSTYE